MKGTLRIVYFLILLTGVTVSGCTGKTTVPKKPHEQRIVSLSPAATAILLELSLQDRLAAVDRWSAGKNGIPENIPAFDMIRPDAERIMALEPDILFVSSMTRDATGTDPFAPFSSLGIPVIYLPVSITIEAIYNDIRTIANACAAEEAGEKTISDMKATISGISARAEKIPETERRSVYMEIGTGPSLYSFGSGVFLNELVTTCGARNIFEEETGWISVNAETVLERNPDVLLTNVPDPHAVQNILSRPGWDQITAVKNGNVFAIDQETSSQPAPGITEALSAIASAVYPEYFPGAGQ